MRRLILLYAILSLSGSQQVSAQGSSPLAPGARVRITVAGQPPYVGAVVAVEPDTVVLQAERHASPVRIPVPSVSRLEMSRGRRSHTGAGIGYGALAGAAAGAVVGGVACASHCGADEDRGVATVVVPALAVLGGGVGAIIGGVIGASRRGERWEVVPSERWWVSVVPRWRGGLTVAVAVRF